MVELLAPPFLLRNRLSERLRRLPPINRDADGFPACKVDVWKEFGVWQWYCIRCDEGGETATHPITIKEVDAHLAQAAGQEATDGA